MELILLLCVQALIFIIQIFLAKSKKIKQLLQLCSLMVITAWTVYYGVEPFCKFNVWLLLGSVVLSFLLYLTSLFIVGTSFLRENVIPIKSFSLKGKQKKSFVTESLRNLYSSSYEELLYRWFLLNSVCLLTKSAWLSIAIISILFFSVHIRKGIAIVQLIDIFVFSVIITVFFYFTVNPVYCILIHIIRNQLVISQKHVVIFNERERKAKYLKLLKARKTQ